jgi:multiple sugar transport system substrate-binding protein
MIAAGFAIVIIVVVLFMFAGSKDDGVAPVTISIWGVDSEDAMKPILSGYKIFRPNATLLYRQVPWSDYKETLLNALASGQGPDVFVIGNHDLLSRGQLLAPAPAAQISLADVQNNFPQAVLQDLTYEGSVFGLPLYMDTLSLVYNKQIFDQAGVALPPATWQDILDLIPRLRVQDQSGQVTRAALAIGGSERSVAYATDILNLIMLQNSTVMADDKGMPSFASDNTGAAAFQFYLQFADPSSPAYTWSDVQGSSLENFAAQNAAMAFAYQSDLGEIRKLAPFLDFGVVGAPQISATQAVNYPSYQALAVWIGSGVQAWAWDFVIFAAGDPTAQTGYLAATGRPAALRALISEQQKDPAQAAFAKATLTARSWKVGDYDKIKEIFSTAIQNVLTGAKTPAEALRNAEAQARQIVPQ